MALSLIQFKTHPARSFYHTRVHSLACPLVAAADSPVASTNRAAAAVSLLSPLSNLLRIAGVRGPPAAPSRYGSKNTRSSWYSRRKARGRAVTAFMLAHLSSQPSAHVGKGQQWKTYSAIPGGGPSCSCRAIRSRSELAVEVWRGTFFL